MSNALIAANVRQEIALLDQTVRDTRVAVSEAEAEGNQMLKTITLANGLQAIREALTPAILEGVMQLQNNPMGFVTDRPPKSPSEKGGYPVEVVRDVTIQAMMVGLRMVGNEVNIIGGRLYAAQAGCERRCKEWPGVTDLFFTNQVPEMKERVAYVACSIDYRLNGKSQSLKFEKLASGDFRISVRLNAGMGEDAAIGKAKRKAFAKLLEKLSGIVVSEGDDDAIDVEAEPASVTQPEDQMAQFREELALTQLPSGVTTLKERWSEIARDENWTGAMADTMVDECRARYAELAKAQKQSKKAEKQEAAAV